MPLHESLKQLSNQQLDRNAVVIAGRAVTYGVLNERAARLNAYVSACPRVPRRQGTLRNLPVLGLLMNNHPQIPEFLVAALAGNCCVVLLDPTLSLDQLSDILDRLPPDVLFVGGKQTTSFEGRRFPVVSVESDADLERLLSCAPARDLQEPDGASPFMVAFTSGTTSRPKAFLRRRHTWRNSLAIGRSHFETHPELHTLCPGPLSHGLSLYALAETLDAGATFHSPGKFDVDDVWSYIADRSLRRLVCVPSVLAALSSHVRSRRASLETLDQITTAGAKLEDDLLRRLVEVAPRARVTEYYGASELGFVTTISHEPSERGHMRGGSGVGQPFPGVEIAIRAVNSESSQDELGAIWVRSDLTIEGYLWQDDQLAFQQDGEWATVGDIGRLDGTGNLELVGRVNGMVISGGNNIYPDEVAECLARHPAVKQACVVGTPDPYLGDMLIAVLQFERSHEHPKALELSEFCAAKLQKYKIPRRFLRTDGWPMTASGKVSTGQLKEWILAKDQRLVPL